MRFLLYVGIIILLLSESLINYSKMLYFSPTTHADAKIKLNHIPLSYPCELDECGCTKESCLTDCCCKKTVNLNTSIAVDAESKSFIKIIVRKIICKEKKVESLIQFLAKKNSLPPLIFLDKFELKNPNHFLNQDVYFDNIALLTQFSVRPISPPPKFS